MYKNIFITPIVVATIFISLLACDKIDNPTDEIASIESLNVSALITDNEIIWIGTDSGLFRYDNELLTHYNSNDGLINDTIRALVIDKNGNLWIGTKRGISKFAGEIFTNYSVSDGLVNNDVRSITVDAGNNVWIGTRSNSISKFDGTHFTNQIVRPDYMPQAGHIHSICCDLNGDIWVASCLTGLSKLSGTTWTHRVNNIMTMAASVYSTKNGTLWVGGAFVPYQLTNNSWTSHSSAKSGVQAITEDMNGNPWLATSSGVLYYHDNTWTTFSEIKGLADNIVLAITCDSKGNIWLGGKGLAKISDY